MAQLLIVRHGETHWNLSGRLQGQVDSALTSSGVAQAAMLAESLCQTPLAAIYSSDLGRAFFTAQTVAQATNVPLYREPLLRERHFGQLQGVIPTGELRSCYQQRFRRPLPDSLQIEPEQSVLLRLADFLHSLPEVQNPLLIVTHGEVILILLRALYGDAAHLALPRHCEPLLFPLAQLKRALNARLTEWRQAC